jgi:hypothetical protein
LLKLVEVLVLVCAGALFIGWQWRDLRQAREQTRKRREAAQGTKDRQDDSSSKGPPHGT